MDETSVTRAVPTPKGSLLAGSHLCDQVARPLGIGERTARGAFLGEPVGVVLAMAGWALSRQEQEGFDLGAILPAWAKDRGRGAWRSEDRRVEDCGHCRDRDPGSADHRGGRGLPSCPACRGSGFVLKPLGLLLAGEDAGRGDGAAGNGGTGMPGRSREEDHHAAPRCLLTLHERANGLPLDGEGIQAWLEWEWEAARWRVPVEISGEELRKLVAASEVVPEREGHRLVHASDWRRWGARGGRETLRRYGADWFSLLALRRWGRITAADLDAARVLR